MIQQLIIALGLLIGCTWCLVNPFAGLITLMGVNMVQPGELYPVFHVLHTERVVALLALVMMFAKGHRLVLPPVIKWMLYFFGACVVSIPTAFWITNSISDVEDFGKVILVSLIMAALISSRQRLRIVLISYSVLVGYLAATSLAEYLAGVYIHAMNTDRIAGLTNASNTPDTLALTICTALPLMYLFTRKGSPVWLRLLMWVDMALCTWVMLLTGARGPFLSLLLMLALAVLVSRRRMLMIPLVVGLCLLVWAILPQQYKTRYLTLSNGQAVDTASYQNRLLSWQGGWQMFLHNPITGIGIGDYTFANGAKYWPARRRVYLNAHSLYFELLGELGLLGVITFSGFVAVLLRTGARVRAHLKQAAARTAAGELGAEALPEWMRLLPLACTLSVIALLYTGYAYHDLYRSTWYLLGAIVAGLDIVVMKEAVPATEPAVEANPVRERAWA